MGLHNKEYITSITMEKLVEVTEALCDAVESLPPEIVKAMGIKNPLHDTVRNLSIPATVANIRMFYYVTIDNSPNFNILRGFEQLKYILMDPRSNWEDLSTNDKISWLKIQSDIHNHVFVIDTNYT